MGDGNPGAFNLARAAGWRLGMAAGILDFAKGALPVAAAGILGGLEGWAVVPVAAAGILGGLEGWAVVPVAAAPVLGHAFSPFLGGRGGKALATTFGIWTGLMLYRGTFALGCCFGLFYLALDADAWAALLGLAAFAPYLAWSGAPAPYLAVWAADFSVVAYRHLPSLRGGPRMRFFPAGRKEMA